MKLDPYQMTVLGYALSIGAFLIFALTTWAGACKACRAAKKNKAE